MVVVVKKEVMFNSNCVIDADTIVAKEPVILVEATAKSTTEYLLLI